MYLLLWFLESLAVTNAGQICLGYFRSDLLQWLVWDWAAGILAL